MKKYIKFIRAIIYISFAIVIILLCWQCSSNKTLRNTNKVLLEQNERLGEQAGIIVKVTTEIKPTTVLGITSIKNEQYANVVAQYTAEVTKRALIDSLKQY